MEFTHAVVSTLDHRDGNFVRLFLSEVAAVNWACEFVRQQWPNLIEVMKLPNGDEFLDEFRRNFDLTEWFFVHPVVYHMPTESEVDDHENG